MVTAARLLLHKVTTGEYRVMRPIHEFPERG